MLLSPSESADVALWIKVLVSLSVGGFLGLVGGLVGLVLGNLRLPAVFFLLDSAPVAAGTNIAISGLSALGGAWRHWREGRIHWGVFRAMGSASFVGAFAGGFFSHQVATGVLLALIAGVIAFSAVTTLAQARSTARAARPVPREEGSSSGSVAPVPRRLLAWEVGIGLAIGGLGGLVGLILGSLRLPAMLRLLRMEPSLAVGTNMAVGLFTGVFGLAGHLVGGGVDWPVLLLMGSSSALGAYYGARLTGRMSPVALLRALGVVLLVGAGSMLWQAIREW